MAAAFEHTILLQDVVKHIDASKPCDLVYIKADHKRGTAGAFGELLNCVKSTKEDKPAPVVHTAPTNAGQPEKKSKNPQHFAHSTRNMYSPASRKMRKIHLQLIVKFNGLRVI